MHIISIIVVLFYLRVTLGLNVEGSFVMLSFGFLNFNSLDIVFFHLALVCNLRTRSAGPLSVIRDRIPSQSFIIIIECNIITTIEQS